MNQSKIMPEDPHGPTGVASAAEAEVAPPSAAEEQPVGSNEASAAEVELEALGAQLEQARSEAREFEDRFMRASAEVENVRRRAESDVAQSRKFAVEAFARELLNVKDSLDLASAVELPEADTGPVAKMREGLELTLRQLDSVFERFSVAVVDPAVGEKFDPELHQAMSMQPSESVEPNHVVAVMQKGYRLHDRLLRPAMVIVARSPEADAGAARG